MSNTCATCLLPTEVDEVDNGGRIACDDCYCQGCGHGHGGLRCDLSIGRDDDESVDPDHAYDMRVSELLGV